MEVIALGHSDCARKKARGQDVSMKSLSRGSPPSRAYSSRGTAQVDCAAQQRRTYHCFKDTGVVYIPVNCLSLLGRKGALIVCASEGLAEGCNMKLELRRRGGLCSPTRMLETKNILVQAQDFNILRLLRSFLRNVEEILSSRGNFDSIFAFKRCRKRREEKKREVKDEGLRRVGKLSLMKMTTTSALFPRAHGPSSSPAPISWSPSQFW